MALLTYLRIDAEVRAQISSYVTLGIWRLIPKYPVVFRSEHLPSRVAREREAAERMGSDITPPVPQPAITWPEGKRFAFTVFDDPDGQSMETTRLVYSFLADLGFRTTIGVWPLDIRRETNSGGETCANPEYRVFLQQLQTKAFEIGFHNSKFEGTIPTHVYYFAICQIA
jgi:hypothetical protein